MGNSSSGIKETPVFGCPAVNIGSRQQSRLRAENVLDTPYDTAEILPLSKTIYDDKFRAACRTVKNPYGQGKAGSLIAQVLAETPITLSLLQKKMTY